MNSTSNEVRVIQRECCADVSDRMGLDDGCRRLRWMDKEAFNELR